MNDIAAEAVLCQDAVLLVFFATFSILIWFFSGSRANGLLVVRVTVHLRHPTVDNERDEQTRSHSDKENVVVWLDGEGIKKKTKKKNRLTCVAVFIFKCWLSVSFKTSNGK